MDVDSAKWTDYCAHGLENKIPTTGQKAGNLHRYGEGTVPRIAPDFDAPLDDMRDYME